MKINILLVILLFFLFLEAHSTYAISVNITVPKEFSTNQIIYFNYTITSEKGENISYIELINCPDVPSRLLQTRNEIISQNKPVTGSYSNNVRVSETLSPQVCIASINIIGPVEMHFYENFSIQTIPHISLELLFCNSSDCIHEKSIFYSGEHVFIIPRSEIPDVNMDVRVIGQDGSSQTIKKPFEIRASESGLYTVEVIAKKSGYLSKNISRQFAVIENDFNIGTNHKDLLPDAEPANPFTAENEQIDSGKGNTQNESLLNNAVVVVLLVVLLVVVIAIMVLKYYFKV